MSRPLAKIASQINKKWAIGIAVAAGLLFPAISIFIIAVRSDAFLNIPTLARLHEIHPELFVLYIPPLLFPYLIHLYYKYHSRDQGAFEKIISRKDETINRNADFAREIGIGNYSVHIIPEGEQDVLGKSLLVMKENLLANHRKESVQNWISEGKNLISNILRMYNKLEELGDLVLEHLVKYIDALQGAIYLYHEERESLVSLSTYAYFRKKYTSGEFKLGYGLP